MIDLRHQNGSRLAVNPEGAFVEAWTAADGTELLYTRRDMPNGKNRGGIPVCAPIFGPGDTVGLSQHGFARNCMWAVDDQNESQVKLSLDNPQSQVESVPPVYAGCGMELTIELLENGLRQTLAIRNIGVEPFRINPAFHPYFPITSGGHAEGAAVIIDDHVYQFTSEELAATQKIDSIKSVAVLKSPQGVWTVFGEGLPLFAVWSESPRDFICIEPTESGYLTHNAPSELQPNETARFSMTITYEKFSA